MLNLVGMLNGGRKASTVAWSGISIGSMKWEVKKPSIATITGKRDCSAIL